MTNHFEPADKEEHERANHGSGESDCCINCGYPFMDHYNGTCPDVAEQEPSEPFKMQRYRWYSNVNWGPCYDPKTQAHYASATDLETLQKHYGPIDVASLQIHNGSEYRWVSEHET